SPCGRQAAESGRDHSLEASGWELRHRPHTADRPRRTRILIATCSGRVVVVHNGIIENPLALNKISRNWPRNTCARRISSSSAAAFITLSLLEGALKLKG